MADPAVATPPAQPQVTPKAEETKPVAAPAPAAPVAAKGEPVAQPAAPKAEEKVTLLGDPAPAKNPAEAAKPGEPAPKADYSKVALPKDSMLDQKAFESLKAQAEKLGLSADAAQAMVDSQHGTVKAYHDGLLQGHQTQVGSWRKEVEANPRLGGTNLKATNEAVTQVLERFAPKGFIEQLQAQGFNWHPGLVELLHNVHEATKGDTFVRGGTASPDAPKGLESMYTPKKK